MKYKKRFRKKIKNAEIILTNLAQVLDEAERNKLQIKLKHGILCSKYGYVLPHGRRWVVRMLVESQFDDEDDDLG